jgi:hypothetical protein
MMPFWGSWCKVRVIWYFGILVFFLEFLSYPKFKKLFLTQHDGNKGLCSRA